MSVKHRASEINYINHIGVWRDDSKLLSQIAQAKYVIGRETISPDTIKHLENYLYWAPQRSWEGDDWRFFHNYAAARLNRVRKFLAERKAAGEDVEKIITVFIK